MGDVNGVPLRSGCLYEFEGNNHGGGMQRSPVFVSVERGQRVFNAQREVEESCSASAMPRSRRQDGSGARGNHTGTQASISTPRRSRALAGEHVENVRPWAASSAASRPSSGSWHRQLIAGSRGHQQHHAHRGQDRTKDRHPQGAGRDPRQRGGPVIWRPCSSPPFLVDRAGAGRSAPGRSCLGDPWQRVLPGSHHQDSTWLCTPSPP